MEFETKLIRDSRLNNITDKVVYSVLSGAAQNTYIKQNATSASPTNITFSLQPPSESTVVSRDMFISAQVDFTIYIANAAGVPNGTNMMQYALREGFQAFPLNQLITTASVMFNNCSVSLNQSDILPAFIRMLDNEELQKYNAMTPVFPDNYKNFQDGVNAPNNPLAGYSSGVCMQKMLSRGCHPILSITCAATGGGRGGTTAADPRKFDNDNTFTFTISAIFTEPLFVSPMLFSGLPQNDAGILGLNQLNITLNLDSQMKRFWSSGLYNNAIPTPITYTLSLVKITPVLYVNYLGIQTTQLLPVKNVLNYSEYPRYITGITNTPVIKITKSETISVNSVQLSQIPDRFIIYARKALSAQNCFDTQSFLVIKSISINFNNCSGLLSTSSMFDLWKLSVANGCKMNWYEWSGYVNTQNSVVNDMKKTISTVGSLLILNPARDLSLPSFLAPGSQGQFNLQFDIVVENNDLYDYAPEIVVISQNSGIMVTELGNSSTFKSLLSMEKVLQANESSSADSYGRDESSVRKVGDGLSNVVHHPLFFSHRKKFREALGDINRIGSGKSGGQRMKHINKLNSICV
jgi:hypothetical protein